MGMTQERQKRFNRLQATQDPLDIEIQYAVDAILRAQNKVRSCKSKKNYMELRKAKAHLEVLEAEKKQKDRI